MTGKVDWQLVRMLDTLRTSHPDIEALYLYGQCYNLFRLIRVWRPDAEPWYDQMEGHIYTRVGAYWYDIRGVHYRLNSSASVCDHQRGDKPHRWGGRDTRRLKETSILLRDSPWHRLRWWWRRLTTY